MLQLLLHKTRHALYLIWDKLYFRKIKPAKDIEIDVVIPVIETDLVMLPLCLEGLRKNVDHTVKNIYLVSPNSDSIKEFATAYGVSFLDESTLFNYKPSDINYILTAGPRKGLDRSGWIYQQLIKLSGKVGTCRYYLVIDADHVLLQPHTFISEEKRTVFYQATEYNIPYYKAIKRLLGFYPVSMFSYVSHKMLFDKQELEQLQETIEERSASKQSWDKIIIANLDSRVTSDFSEFELYGNFVAANKKIIMPWRERMLADTGNITYETLKRNYPRKLSVTLPHYLRNKA